MKKMSLSFALGLLISAFSPLAMAQFDEDRANAGAFDLDFVACTHDLHPALVHLAMTNYSPVDVPPTGYEQASKEEVKAIAETVFPLNYTPAFQRDFDARVIEDGYLADVSMEDVETQENGKTEITSRAIKAMNEIKEILMRDRKYSGMGINYMKSSVTLDSTQSCK